MGQRAGELVQWVTIPLPERLQVHELSCRSTGEGKGRRETEGCLLLGLQRVLHSKEKDESLIGRGLSRLMAELRNRGTSLHFPRGHSHVPKLSATHIRGPKTEPSVSAISENFELLSLSKVQVVSRAWLPASKGVVSSVGVKRPLSGECLCFGFWRLLKCEELMNPCPL